jgi:tRNA1(Val) A37 N6-methylase TrmN6
LGHFEQVVTNPPYLAAAVADPPPDRSRALATVESSADLKRWLEVAVGAMTPTGTLTLIQRSDRLEEIIGHLGRLGCGELTVKRLPPAPRVLVRARRAPTPTVHDSPPLVLQRPEGGYSEAAEAILRHAAALDF